MTPNKSEPQSENEEKILAHDSIRAKMSQKSKRIKAVADYGSESVIKVYFCRINIAVCLVQVDQCVWQIEDEKTHIQSDKCERKLEIALVRFAAIFMALVVFVFLVCRMRACSIHAGVLI